MRYALVRPDGTIDRLAIDIDPTMATRAGWRWLPAEPATPPSFDAATQVLTGPARAVGADLVAESYMVRDKTAGEIDADHEAMLDRMDAALLRVAFSQENRLRALESKVAVTAAQFRAAIKALL